jgi:hypothetical protein
MHGADTLDDLIFHILSEKSQVVSDALDGKVSEYRIAHARYDQEFKEDLKERREKGILNPVIAKPPPDGAKTKKAKIDDFFARQKDLNDFVKKGRASSSKEESKEEEIEQSENEDAILNTHSNEDSEGNSVKQIVQEIKKNPKKRKADQEALIPDNPRKKIRKV